MRWFSLHVLVHTNEIICFWIYAILGVPKATRISPEFDEHFVFYLWISNIHRKYGLKFQEVWFNTSYKVIYLRFQTNKQTYSCQLFQCGFSRLFKVIHFHCHILDWMKRKSFGTMYCIQSHHTHIDINTHIHHINHLTNHPNQTNRNESTHENLPEKQFKRQRKSFVIYKILDTANNRHKTQNIF